MPSSLTTQLRDIHLPAEPGWWPLAPGWWLLLTLLLLTIVLVVLYKQRLSHRNNKAQSTHTLSIQGYLNAFTTIKAQHQTDSNDLKLIQATSMLLRKFCLERSADAARLTQNAWLHHLDQIFDTESFSNHYHATLTQSNYAPVAHIDSQAFIQFIESCLLSYKEGNQHA